MKKLTKKPEKAWEKLKISETKKYEISRLKKICFFREKLAKKKNIPVKRIISDQKIKILCKKEIKQKEKKLILKSLEDNCFKKKLINKFF